MENYILDGAAVLNDNIAPIDEMIVTAVETMPNSAIADIMPVAKLQGPSGYWIEPWFTTDKIMLLQDTVQVDDNSNRYRLEFTTNSAEKLRSTYSPDAFTKLVQSWCLNLKYERQRKQLIDILKGPLITAGLDIANGADLNIASQDEVESVKSAIMQAITSLERRFKLGKMDYSIVGPYTARWPVFELQGVCPDKLHFLGDDTLDKIYIFPTGTGTMARAGFASFEHADTILQAYDPENADEIYFYFCRSAVALNPVHKKEPIVEVIDLA